MDELDTQLAADLAKQNAQKEAGEQKETKETGETPEGESGAKQPAAPEPKMFDEAYVKSIRREAAQARIERNQLREELAQLRQGYTQSPQAGQPEYYDPRVDDMILQNKLNELRADPDLSDVYNETDEEGITFEERLLEKALELQWPIDELDALALKMSKSKIFAKIKQKGIDEAYKSINAKSQASPERNVSSGKNIEEGEVKTVDDAIKKAMKEHGITSLSELR